MPPAKKPAKKAAAPVQTTSDLADAHYEAEAETAPPPPAVKPNSREAITAAFDELQPISIIELSTLLGIRSRDVQLWLIDEQQAGRVRRFEGQKWGR